MSIVINKQAVRPESTPKAQEQTAVNNRPSDGAGFELNPNGIGLKLNGPFCTQNTLLTNRVQSVYEYQVLASDDDAPTCPQHSKGHVKTLPFSADYSKCPDPVH